MGGRTRCVCGKPAGHNRFMIACDKCNYWLHGSCVKVSKRARKDFTVASRLPAKWCCPPCRENPANLPLVVAETKVESAVETCQEDILQDSALTAEHLNCKHKEDIQGINKKIADLEGVIEALEESRKTSELAAVESAHKQEHFNHKLREDIEGINKKVADLESVIEALEESRKTSELAAVESAHKQEHFNHKLREDIEGINKKVADLESVIEALEESRKTSELAAVESAHKQEHFNHKLREDIEDRNKKVADLESVIKALKESKKTSELAAVESAHKQEHLNRKLKQDIEDKNKKIAELESVLKAPAESMKKTSVNLPAEVCRTKASGHLSTRRVDSPLKSTPKKFKRLSLSKGVSQAKTTADDFDDFDRDAFVVKKAKKFQPSMP